MENGKFLTHLEFTRKLKIKINFLQYNSIISSVKNYYSNFTNPTKSKQLDFQPHIDFLMNTTKGASRIYQLIVFENNTVTGHYKWTKSIDITEEQWRNSFYVLKTTTTDTKLRWFQTRILHHILTTNRSVSKFIVDQNDLCEFCGSHSETIQHVLWLCSKIQSFWTELSNILNNRCPHIKNLILTEKLVMFGQSTTLKVDEIFQLIILMAKYFIYRCKVQKINLNIKHFMRELYNRFKIEKHIYQNSEKFKKAWAPYSQLFQSLL